MRPKGRVTEGLKEELQQAREAVSASEHQNDIVNTQLAAQQAGHEHEAQELQVSKCTDGPVSLQFWTLQMSLLGFVCC